MTDIPFPWKPNKDLQFYNEVGREILCLDVHFVDVEDAFGGTSWGQRFYVIPHATQKRSRKKTLALRCDTMKRDLINNEAVRNGYYKVITHESIEDGKRYRESCIWDDFDKLMSRWRLAFKRDSTLPIYHAEHLRFRHEQFIRLDNGLFLKRDFKSGGTDVLTALPTA